MSVDHYAILRISRTATLLEIKDAYRTRAKETHPNSGYSVGREPEEFLAVQTAYEVLSESSARAEYDLILPSRALVLSPKTAISSTKEVMPSFDGLSEHDKAWARYYWEKTPLNARPYFTYPPAPASKTPPVPVKVTAYRSDNSDPAYSAFITFKQSYEGIRVHLNQSKKVQCEDCNGKGFTLEEGPRCTICKGSGEAGQRGFIGRLILGDPCQNCKGDGHIKVPEDCYCNNGVRTIWVETTADVGRGVMNGTIIPVPGGDRLEIKVSDGSGFTRDGDNVKVTKRVTKTTLKRGTTLKLECLDGVERSYKVPPGSIDGDEIILSRCGMPSQSGTEFGDLIITVKLRSSNKE